MSAQTPPPSPRSRFPSRSAFMRTARWVILAGFGIGLVLFLLLWLDQRNDGDFYRAERDDAQSIDGQVFEPLPAPLPADETGRSASGMSETTREIANAPPPPIAPRPTAPAPTRTPVATAPPRPTGPTQRPPAAQPALAPGDSPVPISRPAPEYPAEALRRNESGKVIVRIEVGADGVPTNVNVSRSSRSRALDRAAVQAAKKWRFRPAQRDGQAVAGSVEVPIVFNLQEG